MKTYQIGQMYMFSKELQELDKNILIKKEATK